MPIVSIIIPAYNSEKVISHCLYSLLRQTFKDLEVIIVNDGSKDRTLEICEIIAKSDKRIKIISKQNEGRVIARRTGFAVAKGEFLGFMDHDDYLPKDAISCLYKQMMKHQVDCVVGTRARVFGSIPLWKKKDPIPISGRVIKGNHLWEECYGLSNNYRVDDNFPGLVWGRLYRKSCIDKAMEADSKHLFSDSLLEDWWFSLVSMRYMNSVYVTDDIVYYWRIGGASSGDLPMLEKSNNYFDYRFDFFCKHNLGETVLMRTYVCFVKTFYWELQLKIRSQKYKNEQLLVFIKNQLSTQKVIAWARNNRFAIPADIDKYSIPIINNNPEDILQVVSSIEMQSVYKNKIKKALIRAYGSYCKIAEKYGMVK